jgi:hypothetical protein
MPTPGDEPSTPFEIRDKVLGRLLLPDFTLPVHLDLELIPRKGMKADEFVAHLFATIARNVPDNAPATDATYDASDKLASERFAALSNAERDDLANAYLDKAAKSFISEHPGAQERKVPGSERSTERLARLVQTKLDELESWAKSLTPGTLSASFARTSRISGQLSDALSAAAAHRTPDLILPKDSVLETNKNPSELDAAIREMIKIGQLQADLSNSLVQTAQLALQEAVKSGENASTAVRQARNGVRVALGALILAIVMGALTIADNHYLSRETDKRLIALIGIAGSSADTRGEEVAKMKMLEDAISRLSKPADTAGIEDEIRTLHGLTDQLNRLIGALASQKPAQAAPASPAKRR